jgi:transposase-like protein
MKRREQVGASRRERRAFSDEFKAEAVRMAGAAYAEGKSVAQLARALDVRPDLLRVWIKEARAQANHADPAETLEQEVRRLRREVETLRQEQAFAKKVAAYFAKESR